MHVQHTDSARAVARETGWNLDAEAQDREWSAIGLGPLGQHRDSEALDRSNFDVILADLSERFGEAVDTARFGHWGVGWVEEIVWDAGNTDVREAVERWEAALADYPVADEMAWSELEYGEAVEHIEWSARAYIEREGVEYELRDDRPADWAADVFGWIFGAYSYSRAEEIGDEEIGEALFALRAVRA